MNTNAISEKTRWEQILEFFIDKFELDEKPDLDSILFLIGVQELGKGNQQFKKDDKTNLLHLAVCRLLEPFGYYKLVGDDKDGWPHYDLVDGLPDLKSNEQTILMKKAIIQYFEDENLFELLPKV